MKYGELTRQQIDAVDRDSTVVVAPLGSCEQHGPHLPTLTDSYLVTAVAERLEQARPERVLLLPTLWVGASEHHLPFGGTLSPTPTTYVQLLVELYEPLLADGFRRFLFLNGHGGNIVPMRLALRELKRRHPRCLLAAAAYWELAAQALAERCQGPRKEMGHADEIETSLMLHLHPQLVQPPPFTDQAGPPEIPGLYLAHTMAEQTETGAVGYPSQADAARGEQFLEAITAAVVQAVDRFAEYPLPEQLWSSQAKWRP